MKKYVIGVDVGGTEVKFGLFADTLLEKWSIPTNTKNMGTEILPEIADSIEKVCWERGIDAASIIGVGIGVPGPVTDSRHVQRCVNLGWGDKDVAGELAICLENSFSCESQRFLVRAANDANAAALGELWQGGGRQSKSLVMVTLGTGIGGGIVVDGKIFDGAWGSAGEIGHICCVDEVDIISTCSCGNRGCLEQIASATGIAAYAEVCLEKKMMDSVLREHMRKTGHLDAKDVLDAGKAGDLLADEIVEKAAFYLGRGIAAVCAVINPERILIGGGVAGAGEYLRAKVEKYFRKQAFHTMKDTPIRLGELGNQAGITGAAYRILSEMLL